jgi:hypothetical protein
MLTIGGFAPHLKRLRRLADRGSLIRHAVLRTASAHRRRGKVPPPAGKAHPERGELLLAAPQPAGGRAGAWRETVAPIFPGYLFLRVEALESGLFRELKGLPGFSRFLRDNSDVEPLGERDLLILQHFLSFG